MRGTPESPKSCGETTLDIWHQIESLIEEQTIGRLKAGSTDVFEDVMQRIEEIVVTTALRESDWNVTHAATRLGISRPTLRTKLRQSGVSNLRGKGRPSINRDQPKQSNSDDLA